MNSDFIAEALTRMRADGLVLDAPITDGQLHRCGTEGKENGKDGAYRFHIDDMPVAWWINWRTTDKGTTYCDKSEPEMTSEEREEFKRVLLS